MKTMRTGLTPFMKPLDVHVWTFTFDPMYPECTAWERLLAGDEIVRSKKYKFSRDRLRFIARRGILRQLLGRYCGLDPAEINYRINPYGKLSLRSNSLSFSLSHSEDRVALAFTLEKTVGVDIEQLLPLPELFRLIDHWFSSAEQAGLLALAPEVQLEAFYHVWTQKEAYLKARGEGLTASLKDFSVSVDPDKPGRLLSVRKPSPDTIQWKIACHVPEAGWRMAVCVHSQAEIHTNWYAPDLADFLSWDTSG